MAIDTTNDLIKGHFIHGSGSQTVYHHRAVSQVEGVWPYTVYLEADAAWTISNKAANSFYVTCTGNWQGHMTLQTNEES